MMGKWSGKMGTGMTFSVAGVEKSKTEDEVRPVLSKAAEKSQKSQVPLYQVGKMTKQGRGLPPPWSLAVRGLEKVEIIQRRKTTKCSREVTKWPHLL